MRIEAEKLRPALATYSGALAVQIGCGSEDWLGRAAYARRVLIDANGPDTPVRARADALPVGEAMADLVLLVHALGSVDTPAAVLAEVARVLQGEGRLVVVERRLPQLPGAGRAGRGARLMPCLRLRRLVASAGLDWQGGLDSGRAGVHVGCTSLGPGAYAALAVKRVYGPRLLRPRWKETRRLRRRAVVQEHGHAG